LSNSFERQMSEQSRSDDVRRTSSEIERKPTRGQNKSEDVQRKPTSEQNRNEDVRRMSSEIDKKPSLVLRSRERRHDRQHSKNTYVPAIHFSRNNFIFRQTRASAHRAPSPAQGISPARPC
jgi:hypothetical protein